MRFGRSSLLPSHTRRPDFNGYDVDGKSYEFACLNCNQPLRVKYTLLINWAFGWEENVGEELAAKAKEFYGLGAVRKSPDGGWPSMIETECPECGTAYLVYAGVDEYHHSTYSITLQGITEIRRAD